MSHELLSIKEIARRLKLPESNIRYYRDQYEHFLPSVGSGRMKRFKPESLQIFQDIAQAMRQKVPRQHIEHMLSSKYPHKSANVFQQGSDNLPVPSNSNMSTSMYQNILSTQAGALDRMSRSLQLERGIRLEIMQMREGYSKLKKGLQIVWRQQQKARNNLSEKNFHERLDAMEKRLTMLDQQQKQLEDKLHEELNLLKKELLKCQFWTKRALLQTSNSKWQQGNNPDSAQSREDTPVPDIPENHIP
ncbi:MerR family transcriptional regulator [Desulfonatronovibrio magnus]|uniref:MerR family transcriptional regulator n=1 Tax=Desulfonatronovibrio magnus TaxID=698827 RepID=UPI0006982191|nr:MerR family transcriptional regulator [Desulfonatronovibrio magnus]